MPPRAPSLWPTSSEPGRWPWWRSGPAWAAFPLSQAAEIKVREARRHMEAGTALERSVFAVRGEEARAAFAAALGVQEGGDVSE